MSIGNEPKDDGCKEFDCSMICGISNYMHFMTWFVPLWGVNALLEAGFQISVYHVHEEHAFEGETQIVFRPEYAVLGRGCFKKKKRTRALSSHRKGLFTPPSSKVGVTIQWLRPCLALSSQTL